MAKPQQQQVQDGPLTLTEMMLKKWGIKKMATEITTFYEGCTLESAISFLEEDNSITLCFIGNYAGFVPKGLVVRLFCYDAETKLWTVKDKDLSDEFEEAFDAKFTTDDLKVHPEFSKMMGNVGYKVKE